MKKQDFKYSTKQTFKNSAKISFAAGLVFCISLLTVSFYQFASQAAKEANIKALPKADAIVVLTGDNGRINSAVNLLQAQYGKRLLISGVSNLVSDTAILNTYAAGIAGTYCCIDLDRLALDTKGNAKHTAEWAQRYGFNNVIVVTSSYHMPRSLEHLRNAMPNINLIPAQIIPSDLKGKSTLSMMTSPKVIIEYGKYLLTRAKLEPVVKYMWTSLETTTKS